MRVALGILPLLAGCNALFGLDATHGGDDAGLPDDGDVGRPDASTLEEGRVWGVNVDFETAGVHTQGYEATAHFGPENRTCTRPVETGDCYVEECIDTTPTLPAPDSGTVTIEGDLRLVDLVAESSTGQYPTLSGVDGGFFTAGITLGVYSTGGEVPPFSLTPLAPPQITVTSGDLPSATSPVTVDRAAGMGFLWSGANDDATVVLLTLDDSAGRRLVCRLPSSAGTGAVPSTALLALQAGTATLVAYSANIQAVVAGDYRVEITVAQTLRRSDGDWARGTVTLQ